MNLNYSHLIHIIIVTTDTTCRREQILGGGGGGAFHICTIMGMCHCEGYVFQAI